jgi:hypothetical protein
MDYASQLHQNLKAYFEKLDFAVTNFIASSESQEYKACSFLLNNKKIIYRQAKITPTKLGQFVTIWKRNPEGITAPYDWNDKFDYFIVIVVREDKIGQFIFPKNVLRDHGIISYLNKDGKRGIRVYAPTEIVKSKQAITTQKWQQNYYVSREINTEELKKRLHQLLNYCDSTL